MISPDRKNDGGLPGDLAAAIARAGVNAELEERALQDAIISAIADRRGYVDE